MLWVISLPVGGWFNLEVDSPLEMARNGLLRLCLLLTWYVASLCTIAACCRSKRS